jgi:hypothetical protein
MIEQEKYELELVNIEELCLLEKKCEEKVDNLKKDMKLHGRADVRYRGWQSDLWKTERRLRYIKTRIQSRQSTMF